MRDAVKVSNGCFKFADQSSLKTEFLPLNKSLEITELNPAVVHDLCKTSASALSTDASPVTVSCNQQSDNLNTHCKAPITAAEDDSVWSKVRQGLIKYFTNGDGLDVSWFSKLKATYDEDKRTLSLAAPSHPMRDWIKNNYEGVIEHLCAKENYQLNGVYV